MNTKEKCNSIMDEYLMLDKGEKVPFSITKHILCCKNCRTNIKLLKKAEEIASAPLKIQVPLTDNSIEKLLEKTNAASENKKFYKPLPFHGWIIGGIIMIALLIMSTFSTDVNNTTLSIFYALTVAGCVTAYCAVFVFSNIDAFIKKISTVATSITQQG